MFDVGGTELLLVGLLALLVLGPERLPQVARTVGHWVGRAKAMFNNMRYELEHEAYNKELQDKFDEQMRKMGLDPNDLREPGQTPDELMRAAAERIDPTKTHSDRKAPLEQPDQHDTTQ